jgi:hypothetical protein
MIPIAKLHNSVSRAGVVMGGGPSLEKDLVRVGLQELCPIWIAVNHHGLEFGRADYCVFLDDLQNDQEHPERWEAMRSRGGVLVSKQPVSDVDLHGAEWWQGRYSGHLACWLGCYLGCNPVILCGMDLYQNKAEPGDRNWAFVTPLWEHVQWWQEAFRTCPHPVRIKAVSGPLVEVFGRYNPLNKERS